MASTLPSDSSARKAIPLARGVLDYFPAALAEIAKLSQAGNDKHNPGEPLHWARGKSMDHADCILRHLIDRGKVDASSGLSHTVMVAWRALALLQEECEAAGAPLARGADEEFYGRSLMEQEEAPFVWAHCGDLNCRFCFIHCGPTKTERAP